jgi:hypothetical protein
VSRRDLDRPYRSLAARSTSTPRAKAVRAARRSWRPASEDGAPLGWEGGYRGRLRQRRHANGCSSPLAHWTSEEFGRRAAHHGEPTGRISMALRMVRAAGWRAEGFVDDRFARWARVEELDGDDRPARRRRCRKGVTCPRSTQPRGCASSPARLRAAPHPISTCVGGVPVRLRRPGSRRRRQRRRLHSTGPRTTWDVAGAPPSSAWAARCSLQRPAAGAFTSARARAAVRHQACQCRARAAATPRGAGVGATRCVDGAPRGGLCADRPERRAIAPRFCPRWRRLAVACSGTCCPGGPS